MYSEVLTLRLDDFQLPIVTVSDKFITITKEEIQVICS